MLRFVLSIAFLSLFACGGLSTPSTASPPPATPTPTATPSVGIAWEYSAEIGKIQATAQGKNVVFPGLDESMYYNISQQGDFDGDGTQDAVVGISVGGNCCETTYHFATIRPDGTPFISVEFSSSFDLPTRENNIIVVAEPTRVARYRFDGTRGVDAGSTSIPELTALKELRGTAPFQPGPPRAMVFDLNQDGTQEQISCEIWERWGSLICEVPLPAGNWKSPGCDRFGVLEASTNGYRDLVCNRNIVFRFDGTTYQEDPQP